MCTVINEDFDVRPLLEQELAVIRRNKLRIMEELCMLDVVEHIWAEGCINDWQRQSIKAKKNDFSRTEFFIDIFMRRSYADLDRLIYWLVETNQKHVAKLFKEDGGWPKSLC